MRVFSTFRVIMFNQVTPVIIPHRSQMRAALMLFFVIIEQSADVDGGKGAGGRDGVKAAWKGDMGEKGCLIITKRIRAPNFYNA